LADQLDVRQDISRLSTRVNLVLRSVMVLWWGATNQNSSLALVRCQVINRRVFLCGLCQGSVHHPRHQEHPLQQDHRQDQDHRTVTSFRQSTTFMIILTVQNGI
jgi:hypothetical protein